MIFFTRARGESGMRVTDLVALIIGVSCSVSATYAALPPAQMGSTELEVIRTDIVNTQRKLLESMQNQSAARGKLKELKRLIQLQRKETLLTRKRMLQLEAFVQELESRRSELKARITRQSLAIRKSLHEIARSQREIPTELGSPQSERLEGPRRHLLARMVRRNAEEIEVLKVDLQDAEELERKISEERQTLAYLIHEFEEKESLLEFHESLQVEVLQAHYEERKSQLKSYRKLKDSEQEVEGLLAQFNSRKQFDQVQRTEREVSKAMIFGDFAKRQGKLRAPVRGRALSAFGKNYDRQSKLTVFKKGVDFSVTPREEVRAIFPGKVVFVGELPMYGRTAIVDHGGQYYSLSAGLGDLQRKQGELIQEGDVIGRSDAQATPIYFEIRNRNVAVNPLQWLVASLNLELGRK
jgi:septal ring factor EnvC (AmiA/AmiB activator)